MSIFILLLSTLTQQSNFLHENLDCHEIYGNRNGDWIVTAQLPCMCVLGKKLKKVTHLLAKMGINTYLCNVKGETKQSHDVRNGGICVMMSNSTLPLGFLHSYSRPCHSVMGSFPILTQRLPLNSFLSIRRVAVMKFTLATSSLLIFILQFGWMMNFD